MTEGEAKVIHFTYQKTYTGVPKYWRAQIALTRKIGYVETLGGRRVQVVGDWGGPLSWSMESTSINYPIQGTGADQKYLAMACIAPYLRDIGAYFAWDLHDGVYLFVPNDKVQRAAVDIKYILDNLPYKRAWGFSPPIPLTWDCKTGPSWGGLRDYHPDKGAK
jgi:DNA polymerase-1